MRTRSRLFQRTRAVVDKLPSWTRRLHSFGWLHLLSSEDLNDLTVASYNQRTGFETPEHNLNGLWAWEEQAFKQHFANSKRVIVAGAGGGREMIALSKMGLQVLGFDASMDLVDACRQNLRQANVSADCVFAPPGEVPSGPAIYDGLLIGRGVYHHIPGSDRRIQFLTAGRQRVAGKSPVVIGDFLTRANKRSLNSYALSREIEPGDAISSSFFHYFTEQEVSSELDQAGYDLEEYRDTPFPGGANMAHIIARTRP